LKKWKKEPQRTTVSKKVPGAAKGNREEKGGRLMAFTEGKGEWTANRLKTQGS